ncbi:MAG: indolepyruvate ferredoxin oxidoreductase subunit alpha [Desulfurococcaceae archaeon]
MNLLSPPGTKLALMGNEAIARGAIEAGVKVVTGYPGTPSSEVIMTLHKFSKTLNIYVEWAINERVAFEVAYGASLTGLRAMVTMKAPGLNVASDPIISAAYSGTTGGLVILVADDPGPHTTQTEQDSRWYAKLAKLPMISPSSPQEAKEFTKLAFSISEELELPIFLRTSTRVNHSIGEVLLGEVETLSRFPLFRRNQQRFVRAGMAWNLERHVWLNNQLKKVEEVVGKYYLNKVYGDGKLCVVTEGAAFNYVYEVIKEHEVKAKIIKLGLLYPFPSKFLSKTLPECDEVLIVEELDPYLEENIKNTLFDLGLKIKVYGKTTNHIPLEGELNTRIVKKALGLPVESPGKHVHVHPRPPPLCPGCPHRFTFVALKAALSRSGLKLSEVPIIGDIGCSALSVYQPINMLWTEHSMGASVSMAMGLKIAEYDKPVVAVIGDSTFFHAGIQSLIEAVNKRVDLLILILDNNVVAMTGHQSTPAWDKSETGRILKPVLIEDIVRAIGPDELVIVDPYNLDETTRIMEELLLKPGVKVVIARHACALLEKRLGKPLKTYTVVDERCKGCKSCLISTGCPALYIEGGKAKIITEDCNGCGLCSKFCAYEAIRLLEVSG